jgi:hypothetical protein
MTGGGPRTRIPKPPRRDESMGVLGPDPAIRYRGVALTGGVLDKPGTLGRQQRSVYIAARPPAFAVT